MQQLLKWTLDTIREDDSCFSWMEEYRYEWSPLVKSAVSQVIDGKTVLVLTDESHEWFSDYILSSVNDLTKQRPLLPFYKLSDNFPKLKNMYSTSDILLLEDMLDISYPNGYIIWYIGRGDHPLTKISFRNQDNFLWVFDEELQNSFSFRSTDTLLDIKLIQLFKLFDATLSAVLFGELDLES